MFFQLICIQIFALPITTWKLAWPISTSGLKIGQIVQKFCELILFYLRDIILNVTHLPWSLNIVANFCKVGNCNFTEKCNFGDSLSKSMSGHCFATFTPLKSKILIFFFLARVFIFVINRATTKRFPLKIFERNLKYHYI